MSSDGWDNEWITFSRKTRRGALVFVVAFIIIAVAPRIYKNYFQNLEVKHKYSSFLIENDDSTEEIETKRNNKKKTKSYKKKKHKFNPPKEKFNPNDYAKEDWEKLGLSEKQVESIEKYKSLAGEFKTKKDVKKLYVINDQLYDLIEDKIDLPDSLKYDKPQDLTDENNESEEVLLIELNTATEESLQQISGIGPYFSKQIIAQRKRFKGYRSLEQLKTIYNFSDDMYEQVSPFLTVDEEATEKINLNSTTIDELKAHPYIEWSVAKSIIDLRKRLGEFSSTDELLKSVLVDLKLLKKLLPYIEV